MSGLAVGLLFGLGVFCIYWAMWPQAPATVTRVGITPLVRVADDLVAAGYPSISPRALFSGAFILGSFGFVLTLAISRVPTIALFFGLGAGWLPLVVVRARARARRLSLRELWPDAVDNLASGVRAGLALPEAVAQLGIRGPDELRPAFAAFAEDYRATGRFEDCLDRLKERLADPVGDRLVESLRIAREVGGSDLGSLLRTLSMFLREDSRTRGELLSRQSWTVNAARLGVAAPWLVLAMLSTRPESVAAYRSLTGAMVLIIGAAVTAVAYQLMIRIGRLPEEGRVLR